MKTSQLFSAALCGALVLTAGHAHAVTLSNSTTAPAMDGEDIGNMAAPTGGQSTWSDRPVQGQTFLTDADGGALNAITIMLNEGANAPIEGWKDYQLRLGTMDLVSDPKVLNVEHVSVSRYDADADNDSFFTFTFDTPIALTGNTLYGFDVGLAGSSTGWQSGIPQIRTTGDEYAGGQRFSGSKTNQIDDLTGLPNTISLGNNDLWFHLDIGAGNPTLPGDTDGDGDIDDSDLGTAFSNYTGPLAPGTGGLTAADGDTDGDGDVDDTDLGTLFSSYTGPLSPAAVPEPTSLALLGLGGLLVARRRRV
ncbi:MAG: PEP-CTERM sorting domain-containing protein [Phycisphaeraceae bacterium]